MALYRYVKHIPKKPIPRPLIVSYVMMAFGIVLIAWTLWPIVSFLAVDQVIFAKTISPIADAFVPANTVTRTVFGVSTEQTTNPNTWFPTAPQKNIVAPVNSYKLTIPSLGISDATVIIAGDDLGKSLIHYGGTGLPGEYGNTVIFGHSTLPHFFKGTKDYKAIFGVLPTIKDGDDVIITYDGVTYRYKVYEKIVVEPNDLSPLEQHFDDSYLTIVTCVPPGTYLLRLNVKAKLERI